MEYTPVIEFEDKLITSVNSEEMIPFQTAAQFTTYYEENFL
jgi:hypothetical protein